MSFWIRAILYTFIRSYTLLYDLRHFLCDFRALSYGPELNSKLNHIGEINLGLR